MTVDGSQQFIDSLYAQYAEWGVDLIKYDVCEYISIMYDVRIYLNIY